SLQEARPLLGDCLELGGALQHALLELFGSAPGFRLCASSLADLGLEVLVGYAELSRGEEERFVNQRPEQHGGGDGDQAGEELDDAVDAVVGPPDGDDAEDVGGAAG